MHDHLGLKVIDPEVAALPVTQVCNTGGSPVLGLFDADRAILARFIFLPDSLDRQFGQMFQLGRALRLKRVFKLKEAIDRERDKAQKDKSKNPVKLQTKRDTSLDVLVLG
jgi:hypothetical protein